MEKKHILLGTKKINAFPRKRQKCTNDYVGKVICYRLGTNMPSEWNHKDYAIKWGQASWLVSSLWRVLWWTSAFNKKRQISWHQQFQACYQEVALLELIHITCAFPVAAGIWGSVLIWSTNGWHDGSDIIRLIFIVPAYIGR